MKSLSFVEIQELVHERSLKSVSFDIDGTLYPMRKMELLWWKNFFISPGKALKFLRIKKSWELRRKGDRSVLPVSENVSFFEEFLVNMMGPDLVPIEIRDWITELGDLGVKVIFLSDHGASGKLEKLGLAGIGQAVNCMGETGELKPHPAISRLLIEKYGIQPESHLHVGDRWTDEEQAKMLGSEFRYLAPS